MKNEGLEAIQKIRTVAKGLSRKRSSIYLLLTTIYGFGRKWRKRGQTGEMMIPIVQQMKRKDRRISKNVFRLLVEEGYSEANSKLRCRYANALCWAYVRDCPIGELTAFINNEGGIERCEKKYCAYKRARLLAQPRSKRRTTW